MESTVDRNLVLNASLGADVVEDLSQLLVFEASLERWNERLRVIGSVRAQVSDGRQLEFVQLLLSQQTAG